ncbi:hypothetical protein [Eubacterium oxidoreducens]|uniref:DUF5640 domain-containing protein n=1 Tax=Eubacterium oxidoreducens TaxID=1732 RepID=A0A1G6A052_EUBOX|nr:hypothetical protein [Eubacterium oxidoreducens]SDB01792.1 hypothetical protein SAMN02910417_00078 [Eubacterium oxidoreducens]
MKNIEKLALVLATVAVFVTSGCADTTNEQSEQSDISTAEVETVQDASTQIRQTATKGSLETFSGKYQVQDAKGVYYYFGEDGICYYVQSGTYEFEENGTNVDGDEADLLLITFETMENASQYDISQEDGEIILTTTQSGAESKTTMNLDCIAGEDGISDLEPFEGIYRTYDEDAYRFEFHEDGSCYLIMEEDYETGDDTLTLTALGTSLTYDYKVSEDTIVLSSEDTTIAVLVPSE